MPEPQRPMKLLMVYNFVDEEAHVQAPNFYRSCAEQVFPSMGIQTDMLPNLRETRLFWCLRALRCRYDWAMMACVFCWLVRYGHRYDVVVGWLANGMMAALLKRMLGWSATSVCLILYKLPGEGEVGWNGRIKRLLARQVSAGTTLLLALDADQAAAFASALSRTPGSTQALRYGVDVGWYAAHAAPPAAQGAQGRASLFSPGGACRDDACIERAVQDLDVCLQRFRLNLSKGPCTEPGSIGKAWVNKVFNAPYDQYVRECQRSDVVVIAVSSADKPVGLTSLLECMALGCPVVITRGASSRDYVVDGQTALVFEQGNWRDLQDKISYLLANPEARRQLARAAHQAARTDLSLQTCGEAFARKLIALKVTHA